MKVRVTVGALGFAAWVLSGCARTTLPPVPPDDPITMSQPAPVPTGAVTDPAVLQRDIELALVELRSNADGEVYAGAVEGTEPDALAIAVMLIDGRTAAAGDVDAAFPLMSVSKPFTLAAAVEQRGVDFMLEKIGVSATGLPYNSVAAGAVRMTSEQNPMVNAGAIATHSYLLGDTPEAKSRALLDLYSRLANRPLAVDERWRTTPRALTMTLAYQMQAAERLEGDADEVARRYLESNIVAARVGDLAAMGATLAAGGVQPVSGGRLLRHDTVRATLAAMAVAGLYEASGEWWVRIGLPAKSGVSGAILAVAPGWGAIAAYSPRLDAAGNSVRAGLAIESLARRWGLHTIDRLLGPSGGRVRQHLETAAP